jgi:predicted porin
MVAPVAVMADVTVYGIGQVELSQYDPQADNTDSDTDVNDNHGMGRVGVKTSEDLGNGMTAIAGFEFKADTSDNDTSSGASLSGRDSYVGLKGGFGTVMGGRLKSPYKYAGGVKYDAFVATALEARGHGGMTGGAYGHSSFLSDMLGYSNKFGPVNVDVVYSPETDGETMALSAMYSEGGIEAFVALIDYSGEDNTATENDDLSSTKFGGKFSTGPHSIMLQYETTSDDDGGAGTGIVSRDTTHMFLGYQMKMGMNTFVVQYGQSDSDEFTGTDTKDATYLAIGAYHNFSKTTSLFGGYRNYDSDDATPAAPSATSGPDKVPGTVISVGLRQKF